MKKNNLQLSPLLIANHEKLVQDWLVLSGPGPRNHVDDFFKNLNSPSGEQILPIPDEFSLRELIHHYHLLRDVLFDFLEDKKEINS